ncbi:hypothetical protein DDE18_15980 [Nocardioides gansuensis]|uniref:Putative Flp pilus-assembly TadG-like N-terminal domain-containing protein n=1 Tax=Nocardioides gansuensis TaxID=2138300 RepID=A0A2T8F718_9ACTN|nr:pilus assembly protein TadG-related protein [Nocardioides gansuensis]PVG81514.1 hypothetical protein DDE18_15980 [Nocardioides gansuensis]
MSTSLRRDERGSTVPLIAGMVGVLVLAIGVLVNASSAYLQRQALDTLADGAALRGADLGAGGVYGEGLPAERLLQTPSEVAAAVTTYLTSIGAYDRYPGLRLAGVRVDQEARSVTVVLSAPIDLPLQVPGAAVRPLASASGTAAVELVR